MNNTFTDSYGLLKLFYSHERDVFGMPHPSGSCVLLEFHSFSNLTEYLKFFYKPDVIFELKGVKVSNVEYQYNEQLKLSIQRNLSQRLIQPTPA